MSENVKLVAKKPKAPSDTAKKLPKIKPMVDKRCPRACRDTSVR